MDRLFPMYLTGNDPKLYQVALMVLINGSCLAFYVLVSCLVASLVF